MEIVARNEQPRDPRDHAVVDPYADAPAPPPFINIPELHRIDPLDGAYSASIHRAKMDRIKVRNELLQDREEQSKTELMQTQIIETYEAQRLERAVDSNGTPAWPKHTSDYSKREASQIAIRSQDAAWMTIAHYQAAEAVLLMLRKELDAKGLYLPETETRALADKLAGVAQNARKRVLTGQAHIGPTTWSKAKLGFLSVREEW